MRQATRVLRVPAYDMQSNTAGTSFSPLRFRFTTYEDAMLILSRHSPSSSSHRRSMNLYKPTIPLCVNHWLEYILDSVFLWSFRGTLAEQTTPSLSNPSGRLGLLVAKKSQHLMGLILLDFKTSKRERDMVITRLMEC